MTSAGTAAVTSANTFINVLQNKVSKSSVVPIYFCEADTDAAFHWQRIGLKNQTLSPGMRMGVEMVYSMVTSVLQANVRIARTQHHCLFCTRALALDKECFVHMYWPVMSADGKDTIAHLMIMAYFCSTTACIAAKDQWLHAYMPVSVSPHCAMCGSGTADAGWILCGECKMVQYCSATCQREHSMHKQFCKSIVRNNTV